MSSANSKLHSFQIAQMVRWLRLSNGEAKKLLAVLSEVDKQLAEYLKNTQLTPFSKTRSRTIKAQIKRMVEAIYAKQVNPQVTRVLQETAAYASEVEAAAFKRVLPTRIDVVTPNLGAVKAAATSTAYDGMVLTEWLQKLRDADVDRTWRAVQRGITQGATTDEIVKSVVGTKKLRYKDGVRNVTRNGAKMMVRTLLTGAANVGRQALWEENAHLIKCIMWVSTLDGKTSDICRFNDGRVGPARANDPDWKLPVGMKALSPLMARPPAHPNCRSTTVAVLKSWKELGFDMDELEPGTRSSLDGRVPSTMKYHDWLATQKQSMQVDVLGPTRFKLWQNGTPYDSFYNAEGREYTIAQLRSRLPQAFEEAGI